MAIQSMHVTNDVIDIPRYILQTHCNVELCIDMMFICKQGMLSGIDRGIKYRSLAIHVKANGEGFVEALRKMSLFYNRAGFITSAPFTATSSLKA